MNLLKKSLKTFNQSILNKNPVFSFVSLLTQLRIILSELPGLFCNTETPHTQSMWLGLHPGNRKFFWGFSLSKTSAPWTITEPVKQVYHHGHKCYLIIQTYFGRRFKAYILNGWKYIHAFTLLCFLLFFLFFQTMCPPVQSPWNKSINHTGHLSYQKGVQKFWERESYLIQKLELYHYTGELKIINLKQNVFKYPAI